MFLLQGRTLTEKLEATARDRQIEFIVDGSTCDDWPTTARGVRQRLSTLCRSPLIEAEMTKAEVRLLSRKGRPADMGQTGESLSVIANSLLEYSSNDRTTGDGRPRRRDSA